MNQFLSQVPSLPGEMKQIKGLEFTRGGELTFGRPLKWVITESFHWWGEKTPYQFGERWHFCPPLWMRWAKMSASVIKRHLDEFTKKIQNI